MGFWEQLTKLWSGSLRRQGQTDAALQIYLEVCYFDLNGPEDLGGQSGKAFDRQMGMLAPGVTGRVADAADHLGLPQDQLRQRFLDLAVQIKDQLRLPVAPSTSWNELKAAIKD